ncbi:hypothetical protein [Nitrospirillum iridis]|uniref:Uncharacterized protein n=1 Tax=Nitrospirillum iridis TaxID=765888 RepID=A0A7X0EAV8_9PROT|nr:hypothetical protein [Nitrospirillum iridis]MBB6249525.1 hypothetical protein [Nitrospirillum iridis]
MVSAVGGSIILLLIIGLIGLRWGPRHSQSDTVQDEALQAAFRTVEALKHPQSPPRPALGWSYSFYKDEMTSKDVALAKTVSANVEDLHWPYGPNVGAVLTLSKHPRFGKNAYITLDKGQILCLSYEDCYIEVRFDNRPAMSFSARRPSDGTTEMVFIGEYPKFLKELSRSKSVLIELPMYQDGNRSWRFEVGDLTWK